MSGLRPFFAIVLVLMPLVAGASGLPTFVPREWNDFPVRIEVEDESDLARLERLLPGRGRQAHDRVVDGAIEVRIRESELRTLRAAGFEPEFVEDRERAGRTQAERDWADREGGLARRTWTFPLATYLSHAEIGQFFADLEALRPDIARRYVFGTSSEGRELWGLVISDFPDSNEAEPEVRLAAGIHGDETVMTVLQLNLAHELVTSYRQPGNDRLDAIVDGVELHIQPLFNPDGYVRGIRRNANGVDLNRNFPEPDGTAATQQPEVVSFVQHSLSKHFVASLMGHGGALVANYPWDWTYTRAPDDAALIELSLVYSTHNLPMYEGFFPQGITNGADWYVVSGSLQDWVYDQTGCFDITLEVSNTKWPLASTLPGFWNDNRESLLSFVESARAGIHGVVTDAITGQPLDAVVTIDEIDSPTSTDPANGDYYKLLPTGAFTARFDAPGYVSQTFFRVANTWGVEQRLDVALVPVTTTAPGARLATRIDRVAPNPFNPRTRIEFSLAAPEHTALTVVDARGRRVKTLVDATLDGGAHAVTWEGDDERGAAVGSGVYYVRLVAGDVARAARVTLVP